MNKANRAWVIRPGALGDTLMAVPALADLEGKVEIAFVGRQPGLQFIASRVGCIEDFESGGWHRLFMSQPGGDGPKDRQAERVIAFMNDGEGRLRKNLSFLFPGAPIFVFPSMPAGERAMHVARHFAACLQEAGLPIDPDRCMERCRTLALLAYEDRAAAKKRVVIHPGSGDPRKNFSPRFWIRLIAKLREARRPRSTEVWVLLGPAEGPTARIFERELSSGGVGICDRPGYAKLRKLLGETALYVGQDSGISHLAAMLGAPVIALFRTSRPELWRPLGPFVRVIHEREEGGELDALVLKACEEIIGNT